MYANIIFYKSGKPDVRESIQKQLNFLQTEIHNGADVKMQERFPEGYVFMNALYGLTWCELSLQNKEDVTLLDKAVSEASFALLNLESDKAKKTFTKYLKPEYGIFYQGWTNYLRAKLLLLTSNNMSRTLLNDFTSSCNEIESSFLQSHTPFLESYVKGSWPADMFAAMASLKIHDQLQPAKYEGTVYNFLQQVKQHPDENHLIPHRTHFFSGSSIESARGTSQGLIIRLLAEIDTSSAVEEYNNYRRLFAGDFMGLAVVREYPESSIELKDDDSGPIIFGYGSAATIIAIAASRAVGDTLDSDYLSLSIESIAIPISFSGKKRFLFGQMPLADAFIAWSTATPNYSSGTEIIHLDKQKSSRNTFHIFSGIAALLLITPLIFFRKPKKNTPAQNVPQP